MTPAEAYDATRDRIVSLLHASAQAQGLALSVGQVVGMVDTGLEQAGLRVLLEVAVSADAAAGGYDGLITGEPELEVPTQVEDAATAWRDRRAYLSDYPNLSGLLTESP